MIARRPQKGKSGMPVPVDTNYFPVNLLDAELRIVRYVVQFEPPLPSKDTGRRIKSLLQERIFGEFIAYDGNKNLYVAHTTLQRRDEFAARDPPRYHVCPRAGAGVHEMTLRKIGEASVSDLIAFCRGDPAVKFPEKCLQALDAVLRDSVSWVYWTLGKYIYRSITENNYLELELLERTPGLGPRDSIWRLRGFYQSLCVVERGVALRVDSTASAFHGRTCVSHYLHGRGIEPPLLLRHEGVTRKARKYLAGLDVDCTHQFSGRRYTILGISSKPARESELFDGKHQRESSVFESFQNCFPTLAVDPNLPCLIVAASGAEGFAEPLLVPMDACLVSGAQLFNGELGNKQEEELQALKGSNPAKRRQAIEKSCADLRSLLFTDGYIDKKRIRPILPFRVDVGGDVIQTPARVIPCPDLCNVRSLECIGGRWDLTRVYKSGRSLSPQQWGVVVFRSTVASDDVKDIVRRVIECGQSMGVECFGDLREDSIYITLDASLLENSDELNRALQDLKSGPLKDAVFLFCVGDDSKHGLAGRHLGNFVRLCETEFGWLTKCLYAARGARATEQQFRNIALLINAELGGTNTVLRDGFGEVFRHVFRDAPVILFGMDVPPLAESPPPRDLAERPRERPRPVEHDAAAVVASVDWPHPSQYCARIIHNPGHRVANVPKRTCTAIEELVDVYGAKNGGRRPESAVFFRHLEGDVDPSHSLDNDIAVLSAALRSHCPGVKATWVDVRRGHHTRLFVAPNSVAGASGNVEPGTVVDSGVVHPWQWDFYLASHPATSAHGRATKPTYYRVVKDENGFTADDMEQFVYYLCHTFASPSETTETVAPLYYVKLASGHAMWTRLTPSDKLTNEIRDTMYFLD